MVSVQEVFQLSMAPSNSTDQPTVVSQEFQEIAYLHEYSPGLQNRQRLHYLYVLAPKKVPFSGLRSLSSPLRSPLCGEPGLELLGLLKRIDRGGCYD